MDSEKLKRYNKMEKKNTTLSEKFQKPIKKIVERGKIDILTHIYMT